VSFLLFSICSLLSLPPLYSSLSLSSTLYRSLPPEAATIWVTTILSGIYGVIASIAGLAHNIDLTAGQLCALAAMMLISHNIPVRSDEHTSELQSRFDLVCRLLLEKQNECNLL